MVRVRNACQRVTLVVDDHPLMEHYTSRKIEIPLTGIAPGVHTLTVIAEGQPLGSHYQRPNWIKLVLPLYLSK